MKLKLAVLFIPFLLINFIIAQDRIVHLQNPGHLKRIINTSAGELIIPPNIIPFPSSYSESEVTGSIMLGSPNTIFACWNSFLSGSFGTGFFLSTDGGSTWSGNNSINSSGSGDPGTLIFPFGSQWSGRIEVVSPNNTPVIGYYSTNNGINWSASTFNGASSLSKGFCCVDDIAGSPFFGRAYAIWSNFGFASPPVVFAYSTDGGVNWTGYQTISPASDGSHYCDGGDIAIGPGGVIYCVWAYSTLASPYTEVNMGFTKSTNGGITWSNSTNNAVPTNGIRSTTFLNNIRVNGFPRIAVDRFGGTYNGSIYAVMGEKNISPATDLADMCLLKSTDGGNSWTHTRINQDSPANGKAQFLGSICVDPGGGVNCTYYDQRNTTGNVCEFWLSRSVNGGSSWSDFPVSDHQFTPAPIPGLAAGYQGDYTGIVAGSSYIWPFWMDNSSGHYQIWTVGITYSTLGISGNNNEIPKTYSLSQNYPNPFNPSTKIGLRIAKFGNVKLTVYDILGKEAAALVNQNLQPGSYEVTWDASNYPSGVYFYKLEAAGFTDTKRAILIK